MQEDFIPVILGTDINAYGTARSLHEEYGVVSHLLGSYPLKFTQDSAICRVQTWPDFAQEDRFLDILLDQGRKLGQGGQKLLLISCSDGYTQLITRKKEALAEVFAFNYIDQDLQEQLENKKDFYQICQDYGLAYPQTLVVDRSNYRDLDLPFDFPVAAKANDSIAYLALDFPGKKKAYKADHAQELAQILEAIYQAGYQGEMILQDFIPGDASTMAVVNAYVDRQGRMTMASLGKCILDEVLPESIGNYNALLTMDGGALYQEVRDFLEAIGYRGYANFDFKFDHRDGRYKVFEINIRQGRASYYMNAGGLNYTRFLVEDVIYGRSLEPVLYGGQDRLWLYVDPWVVKRYASPEDLDLVRPYLEAGKVSYTQWYDQDRNFKRWLFYWRRRLATIRYYPKFSPKKPGKRG